MESEGKRGEQMMPAYAKAILCVYAKAMRETIDDIAKSESDPIMAHKLAEVKAECEWCEREYGEADNARA